MIICRLDAHLFWSPVPQQLDTGGQVNQIEPNNIRRLALLRKRREGRNGTVHPTSLFENLDRVRLCYTVL